MAALKVSVLLVLVAQSWTAPLKVIMDGVEFTGTGFCAGDNVAFICDVQSNVHQWSGPGFSRALSAASPSEDLGPDNSFTLAAVNSSALGIITSFSVKVYSGFNGASITCSDGVPMSTNIQTATATVLGPPPAPTIRIIASADFQSYNVTLSTAEPSARCVLQYSLTITENGEPLTTMTIGSSGTGSVGGLNLCKNMYTFTAVGVTKDNSSSSASVPGLVDFRAVSELSGIRVVEGMVQWAISSSLPGECYGSYSLRLSQCTIEDFAILPALNLSDDAVSAIFAGVSAATSPTIMATGSIVSYERVNISVGCVQPTLRTSITPANISGSLMLSSTSIEASTSACNISLMAEGVASTSSLQTNCHLYSGGGGGRGNNAAVIAGVLVGIGILGLMGVISVVVVLLCCRASQREVKGQRLQHESPAIQLNNPARSPGDFTNQPPIYEDCISAYENTDVIMQPKAPEAANVGPSVGDYVFSQCNAYGVHKKPGEMMEDGCYAQVETARGSQ